MKALKKCGIAPFSGIGLSEILKFRRDAYQEKPYLLLLIALGGSTSRQMPISPNIWHVHRDSVKRSGDYAAAADRIVGLTRGCLPLANISDLLDAENEAATLRFTLNDTCYEWTFSWNGASLDNSLFTRFALLLHERDSSRRLVCCRLGGHDALIGCFTPEERTGLEQLTGLTFTDIAEQRDSNSSST